MTAVITRTATGLLEVRAEQRELVGLAVPYGRETRIGSYVEQFARGAFAGTDPAAVPLTATHPRDGGELPIGVSLELRDEADGLHGVWRLAETRAADEVLALAAAGVKLGLSIGFVPGSESWNRDRTRVVRTRAGLDHVAVVRQPAYPDAQVAAVRQLDRRGVGLLLARLRQG